MLIFRTGRWADFNDSSASLSSEIRDPYRSREAYWMVYRIRDDENTTSLNARVHKPAKIRRDTESEPMEQSDWSLNKAFLTVLLQFMLYYYHII